MVEQHSAGVDSVHTLDLWGDAGIVPENHVIFLAESVLFHSVATCDEMLSKEMNLKIVPILL